MFGLGNMLGCKDSWVKKAAGGEGGIGCGHSLVAVNNTAEGKGSSEIALSVVSPAVLQIVTGMFYIAHLFLTTILTAV
jgi:hypothetical protein